MEAGERKRIVQDEERFKQKGQDQQALHIRLLEAGTAGVRLVEASRGREARCGLVSYLEHWPAGVIVACWAEEVKTRCRAERSLGGGGWEEANQMA